MLARKYRQEERSHHQLQPGGGVVAPGTAGGSGEGANGSESSGEASGRGGGGSGVGLGMPDDDMEA
jgi:hypothetical protein